MGASIFPRGQLYFFKKWPRAFLGFKTHFAEGGNSKQLFAQMIKQE